MTSTNLAGDAGSLIRTDRRGRMLIAAEQREALLDAFERSGLSAMAYCRQNGLIYQTFAAWVQKRRCSRIQEAAPAFAEVVVETRSPVTSPATALRVTLPSGAVLELSSRDQLPLAIELLRALDPTQPC